jgi:hypothetical protein
MKETRTITIEPDQDEQLCEYVEETGQTVEEALREALTDHIDSVITRQLGIARHNRN